MDVIKKNAKTNTFHKTIVQRFLDKLGMTWADNIRPYGVCVKYKLFRDYYCKNSSLRSE